MQDIIDENEAYERRESLNFSGSSIPASSSGEICVNLVKDLIAERLSLNISASTLNAQDQRHLIRNQNSLRKFCDENVKVPLENFLKTKD